MEAFHELIKTVGNWMIYLLDFIGIIIIIYGALKALYYLVLSKFDFGNGLVKIALGESIALSLQFMMGAEIISTVLVHDFTELIFLVITLIVRVLVTLVVHWELKHIDIEEEKEKLKH